MESAQPMEMARIEEAAERAESVRKKGISGSTLKLIAIITMLTDHVGAVILMRLLMASGYMEMAASRDVSVVNEWLMENRTLYISYNILRMIGRVAFPIFCFLLVEGFMRTRNAGKYALRLGIFAIISEIPFNLALTSKVMEFSYQNVYFTLLMGLLTMMAFDWIGRLECNYWGKVLLCGIALIVGAGLAECLRTDYGAIGVVSIMILYILRNRKAWQIAAGCIAFLWEITAPLAFIPIGFYNGKRGLKLKYFFYVFYPLHLLILYLICMGMGITGYSAI